jgi:hypothetical protein
MTIAVILATEETDSRIGDQVFRDCGYPALTSQPRIDILHIVIGIDGLQE